MDSSAFLYSSQMRKSAPDVYVCDKLIQNFNQEKSILPLFEAKMSDYVGMKQTSMAANEYLQARWKDYSSAVLTDKVNKIFMLSFDHYHFKNQKIRYAPTESYKHIALHARKELKSGPGCDKFGQLPISNEQHLRRSRPTSKTHRRLVSAKIKAVKKKEISPPKTVQK